MADCEGSVGDSGSVASSSKSSVSKKSGMAVMPFVHGALTSAMGRSDVDAFAGAGASAGDSAAPGKASDVNSTGSTWS